jgi:hypothetical protein
MAKKNPINVKHLRKAKQLTDMMSQLINVVLDSLTGPKTVKKRVKSGIRKKRKGTSNENSSSGSSATVNGMRE